MTLCRHCKRCGKSLGKENLKRKALRWPGKTHRENADSWWDWLFQVRAAATGKARSQMHC